MCSISGSFNPDIAYKYYEDQTSRGVHSHSVFMYASNEQELYELKKDFGVLDKEWMFNLEQNDHEYFIIHSQAPTTESKTLDNIHPARSGSKALWHNGIIKQIDIDFWNNTLDTKFSWDTELLLMLILRYGFEVLDRINGSFACIFYDGKDVLVFRNEIAPLYVTDQLNICSQLDTNDIDKAYLLEPNKVFKIDFTNKELNEVYKFHTFENPYFF